MSKRLMVWLFCFLLVLPVPCMIGCDGNALLQDANAVTLESTLISMQSNILTYAVYKYMNLPMASTTGL